MLSSFWLQKQSSRYGNALNLLLYRTTGLLITELIFKPLSSLLLKIYQTQVSQDCFFRSDKHAGCIQVVSNPCNHHRSYFKCCICIVFPFCHLLLFQVFSVFFIPSGHIQLVFSIPICLCWRINLVIQARQITGFLYRLF